MARVDPRQGDHQRHQCRGQHGEGGQARERLVDRESDRPRAGTGWPFSNRVRRDHIGRAGRPRLRRRRGGGAWRAGRSRTRGCARGSRGASGFSLQSPARARTLPAYVFSGCRPGYRASYTRCQPRRRGAGAAPGSAAQSGEAGMMRVLHTVLTAGLLLVGGSCGSVSAAEYSSFDALEREYEGRVTLTRATRATSSRWSCSEM